MSLANNHVKGDLSFLSQARNCSESTWRTLVSEKLNSTVLDDFQQKSVNYILSKENWTKDEYVSCKESINKLEYKDLQYCKNSILKTLEMDDKELLKELYEFAKVQDFYPFLKRTKNKTGFRVVEQQIKEVDAFKLMIEISRKIRSFSMKLVSDILKEEDPYIFADLLIEILEDRDEVRKNQILENYDNNFSYLKDFLIFSDIYFAYRNDFFKNLINSLALTMANANNRNRCRADINIFDYVKSKRRNEGK